MSSNTCPGCEADLRGEPIPQEYLDRGFYPEGMTHYSRMIGVEVRGVYDGQLFCQCPDCGHRWHRWPKGTRQYNAAERFLKDGDF